MGIMYSNKLEVRQLEGYNLTELESISEKLPVAGEILEDDIENYVFWIQKNGFNANDFVNFSKEHKNILFHVKSCRTEDFGFDNTDISFHWFLNGKEISCYSEIKPLHSDDFIKQFVEKNTLEHICDFSEFGVHTNSTVVLRCRCGKTKTFYSNE